MPRFELEDDFELKLYLEYMLIDENRKEIINSVVNNDTEKVWNFVVGYKLIALLLKEKKINDKELAFLAGKFLGYYESVELLYNSYEEKKKFEVKMGDLIAKDGRVLDLSSDLYMIPSLSHTSVLEKYDKDMTEKLEKAKVIKTIDSPVEKFYMLTDEARLYMKERYYSGIETETENKEDTDNKSVRARTLYLLRQQNKTGGQNEKNFN